MAEMPLGDTRSSSSSSRRPRVRAAWLVLDALRGVPAGCDGRGAYVRFLRTLLEPHGIAVLDAWHPATRAAARPTLVEALRRATSIDEALALRMVAIERAGFRAQVARVPRLSLVFRSVAGVKERVPIAQAATWRIAPIPCSRRTCCCARWSSAASCRRWRTWRVPGEIAYFAQVGAVADALGSARAARRAAMGGDRSWSRASIVARTLGMVLDDLRTPHEAEKRLGDRAMPAAARDALEGIARGSRRRMGALKRDGRPRSTISCPDRVIEGARHQMLHRVDRLERRLRAAARARNTEACAISLRCARRSCRTTSGRSAD
jgi:hypothetical protein